MNRPIIFLHWDNKTKLVPASFSCFLEFSPKKDSHAKFLHFDRYNYVDHVSWMPDPYCIAVNAFNFSWKTHKIYAFPPFSLVGAAISKLIRDNTIGIMIIPKWTTQYWFLTMLTHLIYYPIQLLSGLKTLSLIFKPSKAHAVLHSSVFGEKLKKSSSQLGNLKLQQNTNLSLTDGNFFVYEGVKIVIHHL